MKDDSQLELEKKVLELEDEIKQLKCVIKSLIDELSWTFYAKNGIQGFDYKKLKQMME